MLPQKKRKNLASERILPTVLSVIFGGAFACISLSLYFRWFTLSIFIASFGAGVISYFAAKRWCDNYIVRLPASTGIAAMSHGIVMTTSLILKLDIEVNDSTGDFIYRQEASTAVAVVTVIAGVFLLHMASSNYKWIKEQDKPSKPWWEPLRFKRYREFFLEAIDRIFGRREDK